MRYLYKFLCTMLGIRLPASAHMHARLINHIIRYLVILRSSINCLDYFSSLFDTKKMHHKPNSPEPRNKIRKWKHSVWISFIWLIWRLRNVTIEPLSFYLLPTCWKITGNSFNRHPWSFFTIQFVVRNSKSWQLNNSEDFFFISIFFNKIHWLYINY